MRCGYGGFRIRTRAFRGVETGGNFCTEPIAEKDECFQGCCKNEFDCVKSKQCMNLEKVCNYVADCQQKEDEHDVLCKERCYSM